MCTSVHAMRLCNNYIYIKKCIAKCEFPKKYEEERI